MAQKPRPAENVVPLFGDDPVEYDEVHLGRTLIHPAPPLPDVGAIPDLNGKPKVLAAFGGGGVGKTMWLRWATEQLLSRGSTARLVAIDPENRDMMLFFQGVYEPAGNDPARVATYLKGFFDVMVKDQASGLIDTGAGDTAFGRVVAEIPTLVQDLAEHGVAMVAVYLFDPRITNLSTLATMEGAGFRPGATALILNDGKVVDGRDPDVEFAGVRRHSVYQAALDRGAIELRMPRLSIAKKIEDRRVQFRHAVSGAAPDGRKVTPLGFTDVSALRAWLARMDEAMAPIVKAGWIP